MGLAAAAAQIVGMIHDGTVWPTLAAMLLCALGSLLGMVRVLRSGSR